MRIDYRGESGKTLRRASATCALLCGILGGGLGPLPAFAQEYRAVDLKQHCLDTYGPDAFITRRLTDGAPMCTIRTNGGRALAHHVIDITSICGPEFAPELHRDETLECSAEASGSRSLGSTAGEIEAKQADKGPDDGDGVSGDARTAVPSGGNSGVDLVNPSGNAIGGTVQVGAAELAGTWKMELPWEGITLELVAESDELVGRIVQVPNDDHKTFLRFANFGDADFTSADVVTIDLTSELTAFRSRLALIPIASGAPLVCPAHFKDGDAWPETTAMLSRNRIEATLKIRRVAIELHGSNRADDWECYYVDDCPGCGVSTFDFVLSREFNDESFCWSEPPEKINLFLEHYRSMVGHLSSR